VSIVRFLVAAQSLPAITRIIPVLPESDAYRETRHYLMLLSLGTTCEAAKAFWEALQHDLFASLYSRALSGIDECISRLTVECDPGRRDSLQSKLLRHRNKLSFHWDMKEVRKSLARIEDEIIPAWAGGSNFITNALPIVECVTFKGLEILAGSVHDLQELIERVPPFELDLSRVAEAAYSVAIEGVIVGKRNPGGAQSGV